MINTNKIKQIKLVLTDCDGVLTDGGMYYGSDGTEFKKFNTKDGMAFAKLKKLGLKTGIVTGENTVIVKNRADKLKMDFLILGSNDKLNDVNNLISKYNIKLNEVLYFGDDVNDIELLKNVGISVCPKDAVMAVKRVCNYKCKCMGGEGVIREFYDKFFKR